VISSPTRKQEVSVPPHISLITASVYLQHTGNNTCEQYMQWIILSDGTFASSIYLSPLLAFWGSSQYGAAWAHQVCSNQGRAPSLLIILYLLYSECNTCIIEHCIGYNYPSDVSPHLESSDPIEHFVLGSYTKNVKI